MIYKKFSEKMEMKIALEWNETIGVLLSNMYPMLEGLELMLQSKTYGEGISVISDWRNTI